MSRPTRLFRTLLATCVLSAASSVPAAIPDDEPNLEDLLMSANGLYQLRYSDNQFSPHYMPASQVQFAADALDRSGTSSTGFPLGHHAGFANLGLRAPFFLGGVRDVTFWDCKDPEDEEAFDCDNGFAVLEQIIMPSPTYRARSSSCIRMIVGHELFHHVEFAYTNAGGGAGCGNTFGITACEGQARAMQDKVYSDLDLSPGASCIAGFQTEVNGYLGSPDRELWSSGYASALFWTYLMEQYGTFNEEPYRGADFITAWWELAEDRVADPDVYGITADTIKLFEPKATLLNTYHDFTIANLLKNFSLLGLPADAQARYSYIDEKPHLNQNNTMTFNAVKMTATATVGANQTGTLDFDAQKFGGDYLRFNVGSCPAGNTLEFQLKPDPTTPNPTPTTQALISLVLVKAPNVPVRLYKWRANTAKVSAVQPVGTPYQQAYFIVAGRNGHYAGRATAQCKPGPLAPIVQFAGVQNPQAPSGSRLGTVHVQVPDGAAPNNSVIGLSASDLRVRVGGVDAVVESFVPQGDGYRLRFRQPALSGPGPFPVAVDIGTQSTTLANAIRIDDPKPEVAFVLDLTSSMPTQAMLLPAIQKAREAAARMSTQSRVAVIGFAGNGVEPDLDATVLLPLAPLSASQRGTLESVLGSLSGSTQSAGAPGDGVQAAIDQFTAQGGTGPKSIVLMTDGGIGEGRGLADLLPALRAGGIAVHVIAFGPRTDQPFLDRLARSTGGTFHYIPTVAAGPEAAALDLAAHAVDAAARGEHVLLARQVPVPAGAPVDSIVRLDPAFLGTQGAVVFSIETPNDQPSLPSSIRLFRPDTSEVLSGAGVEIVDTPRGRHFRLESSSLGDWRVQVAPSVAGGGTQVKLETIVDAARIPALQLSLAPTSPDTDGLWRLGTQLQSELLPTPPQAAIGGVNVAAGDLNIVATVQRPDGESDTLDYQYRPKRSEVNMGATTETWYTGLEFQDAGSDTGFVEDPMSAGQRGSYRLLIDTTFGNPASPYVLRTTASYAVLAQTIDTDLDTLPDAYERDRSCLDPQTATVGSDPDADGLNTVDERRHGTDPCLADTDEGGETDGSEVTRGRDPLNGTDDAIGALEHVEIVSRLSQHEQHDPLPPLATTLRFDVGPGFGSVAVARATSVQGPYQLITTLSGASLNGRHVDTGLIAGQTYCYILQPRTATGAEGVPSDAVCAVARADMTAPTGMITLEDGVRSSSKTVLSAQIDFDNESSVGASMRLIRPDGSDTGWTPLAPMATLDTTSLPRPGSALVQLQLRDAAGNESEWYVDEIDLVAAATVGGVTGLVQGLGAPLPLALARVLGDDTLPSTMAAGDGRFQLEDLPPGTYTIEISHPGFLTAQRSVTIGGGVVGDIGLVTLEPVSVSVFSDSFE